jgi:hypothetical protein
MQGSSYSKQIPNFQPVVMLTQKTLQVVQLPQLAQSSQSQSFRYM